MADPSAFAAMMPAAAEATDAKVETEAVAKKEESEDESDEDMGFGLFD